MGRTRTMLPGASLTATQITAARFQFPGSAKQSQTAVPPALAQRRRDAGNGAAARLCPGAGQRARGAPHGRATAATV